LVEDGLEKVEHEGEKPNGLQKSGFSSAITFGSRLLGQVRDPFWLKWDLALSFLS